MLCRKFRQIFYNKSNWNDNLQHFLISTRFSKKCVSVDGIWALYRGDIKSMSSLRVGWKDLSIMRLLSAWRRSYFVSTVVRRCRRDRGVREVIQRFRHTLLRPRQTLLLSATAAYKSNSGEGDSPPSCEKNITDEELQELLKELESVNDLSKKTLFCTSCGRRLVIDKKQSGVTYCSCKEPKSAEDEDGWIPFMEADDVIVWRKLYKAGQPYYAYKVYGRYKELRAQDFAAVQVDGAYRRVWDSAVASLSVVERQANGVEDQTVLHWEVLWPRLFANRDYVYIRRHKEFDTEREQQPPAAARPERPTVHSNAKRKALEDDGRAMMESGPGNDKVYIIASRSCEHTKVPHSKHAIRVADFWSHMVIKTLDGVDKPGMEFVLTYYEEPAVGGLPSGVATWATGRAAPAFLGRQRRAAAEYRAWRAHRTHQDLPDYIAFGPETEASLDRDAKAAIREQDMESSKQGPDLESDMKTHEKGTQTDTVIAIVEAQEQITTETVSKDGELVTVKSESDKNKHKPVVLEKCNEQINDKAKTDSDSTKNRNTQNSEQKATNGRQEIKNGEHETGNGRQETKNGERETVSGGLESCKSVSGTEIVTQKSGKNKNGEKEKADGRQEIQDGDSKKEERAPEEESSGNSSWWRYLYPFNYFA